MSQMLFGFFMALFAVFICAIFLCYKSFVIELMQSNFTMSGWLMGTGLHQKYSFQLVVFLIPLTSLPSLIFCLVLCRYAPECLEDLIFTKHSDVWSYGTTLWEMFTFGRKPMDFLNSHAQSRTPLLSPLRVVSSLPNHTELLQACIWSEPRPHAPALSCTHAHLLNTTGTQTK